MKNYYKNQRDRVIECINNAGFGSVVKICEENAGLHFLLEIKTQKSDGEIKEVMKNLGIKVMMLSDYFGGEDISRSHVMIINYSGINIEKFKEKAEKIKLFYKNKEFGHKI